jgi:hypothetical protein
LALTSAISQPNAARDATFRRAGRGASREAIELARGRSDPYKRARSAPYPDRGCMSRSFRMAMLPVAAVLFVLGAFQLWHGIQGFSGPGPATVVTDDKLAAIKTAASEFQALAQGSEKSGQPPRQTDPKAKPLLDTVLDTSILDNAEALPPSDIANVNEWMLQVLNVGEVYIFAGTGYADFSKIANLDSAQQQKLQTQVTANTATYAPEIGRYYDTQLAVMRALVWAVDAEMSADPNKYSSTKSQNGISQLRAGLVKTLVGVVTTFPTDGLTDSWRRDRLTALMAMAPKAAAFLLPDQRKTVHDITVEVARGMTDTAVQSGLNAFADVVAGPGTGAAKPS